MSGSDTPLAQYETRMSPIFSAGARFAAKNVADDTAAELPSGIGIRPREYDFTERLLNADADPLTRDCERCLALPLALALLLLTPKSWHRSVALMCGVWLASNRKLTLPTAYTKPI